MPRVMETKIIVQFFINFEVNSLHLKQRRSHRSILYHLVVGKSFFLSIYLICLNNFVNIAKH